MVSVNLGPDEGLRKSARRRRPRVMSLRHLKRERRGGLPIVDDDVAEGAAARAPELRSECRGGARPCPFVSCRFHLYLDVNEATGSIKLNFPDKEPWEMSCSCALDVAEEGGLTLDVVGDLLNMTRERARQLEHQALEKILDVLDDDDAA